MNREDCKFNRYGIKSLRLNDKHFYAIYRFDGITYPYPHLSRRDRHVKFKYLSSAINYVYRISRQRELEIKTEQYHGYLKRLF